VSADSSVGRTSAGEPLIGVAPSFPFSGIINYYYDGFLIGGSTKLAVQDPYPLKGNTLQFWDSRNGTLRYLSLGDDLVICGPGFMVATTAGIEIHYLDYGHRDFGPIGSASLHVPWGGDGAYPRFVYPGRLWNSSDPTEMHISNGMRIAQPKVDIGIFEISTAADSRFYEFDGSRGLLDLGSNYSVDDIPERPPDWEISYYGEMVGTDGRNYAVRSVLYEPACGYQITHVVSAETGRRLLCGWSYLGPILVDFDETLETVSDPAFPVPPPLGERSSCDHPADLRELAVVAEERRWLIDGCSPTAPRLSGNVDAGPADSHATATARGSEIQ